MSARDAAPLTLGPRPASPAVPVARAGSAFPGLRDPNLSRGGPQARPQPRLALPGPSLPVPALAWAPAASGEPAAFRFLASVASGQGRSSVLCSSRLVPPLNFLHCSAGELLMAGLGGQRPVM